MSEQIMQMATGYTLDQLLSWCLEDRLIDSYQKQSEVVVIIQGDLRHELAIAEAETFLKGIFRHSPIVKTQKLRGDAGSGLAGKDRNEA